MGGGIGAGGRVGTGAMVGTGSLFLFLFLFLFLSLSLFLFLFLFLSFWRNRLCDSPSTSLAEDAKTAAAATRRVKVFLTNMLGDGFKVLRLLD